MSGNEMREKIKKIIADRPEGAARYLSQKLLEFRELFGVDVLNPLMVVNSQNIDIGMADLTEFNVRGFLKKNEENKYHIVYDKKLINSQLRYTIMHEVAHKLLIDYSMEFIESGDKAYIGNIVFDMIADGELQLEKEDVTEKLCNEFAQEALMPREWYKKFIKKNRGADFSRIAEYFGVEESMVEYYSNLWGE